MIPILYTLPSIVRIFKEIEDCHLSFTGERLLPGDEITITKRGVRLYNYRPVQVAGFVDDTDNHRWLLCSEAELHHKLWKENNYD